MVRVKSVPDPLPLKWDGILEMVWETEVTRSFRAWLGFCWYQCNLLLSPWLAWQVMVAFSPGVLDRKAGDWVSTVAPLEAGTTSEMLAEHNYIYVQVTKT